MQQPPTASPTMTSDVATAVPTLKVMRLQKPELDIAKAGTLASSDSLLGSSLCLPDSFGQIHVGETFTAYLGALNVSKHLPVTNLTVTAQLQTPSQRWHMASETLDQCNAAGGCELQPGLGIDSIVSHTLEEAGQHILRVEVGYGGPGGALKSLRKFYRFQVSNPLAISELAYRTEDSSCFLSVSLQNNGQESKSGLTISSADCEATSGLITERICHASKTNPSETYSFTRGVDLFDQSGRLEQGDCKQHTFRVSAPISRGIKEGDQVGKATFTWHKACGEVGQIASIPVTCRDLHRFLDQKDSGDGTDVKKSINPIGAGYQSAVDLVFPVTVEPITTPTKLQVGIPFDVDFSVQNHSNESISAQLQFRLENMKGIAVCGPSSKNLEEIPANGGNVTARVRFIPLSPGLAQLTGCYIVNLATGQSIPQRPMLNTMVVAK